jgi:uncharacterized protein involved in exopolysaccharide biosynthesis
MTTPEMDIPPMTQQELDIFDLRTLIRVVWRAKWLIGGCAIGMAIVVFSLTFLLTPYYRVTTVVADASEAGGGAGLLSALGQIGSLASLAGVGLNEEVRASDEALAVLSSDDFIDGFISRHGLMPVLYADQWDAKSGTWTTEKENEPTIGKAIRYFRTLMTVSTDRRTQLISVSIDWKDRALVENWGRALIEDINAEMQGRALRRAQIHIQYLRKQLDLEASIETRQAVGRLLEAQLKQEMLASVSTDYVFKVVSRGRRPESDRFVRPRRALLAALGFILGSGLGVIAAFIRLEKSPKPS